MEGMEDLVFFLTTGGIAIVFGLLLGAAGILAAAGEHPLDHGVLGDLEGDHGVEAGVEVGELDDAQATDQAQIAAGRIATASGS